MINNRFLIKIENYEKVHQTLMYIHLYSVSFTILQISFFFCIYLNEKYQNIKIHINKLKNSQLPKQFSRAEEEEKRVARLNKI